MLVINIVAGDHGIRLKDQNARVFLGVHRVFSIELLHIWHLSLGVGQLAKAGRSDRRLSITLTSGHFVAVEVK